MPRLVSRKKNQMNLDMSESVSIHTAVLIWTDLRRGIFIICAALYVRVSVCARAAG